MRRFFRFTKKGGKALKQDIPSQTFYGNLGPKEFKAGEFISDRDIKEYRIPSHLFIHPDSLRNRGAFDFAAKRKKVFSVGIIRTIKGLGDILILSVIGKALKKQYPGQAKVWFAIRPDHAPLLKYNPYIDKIFKSKEALIAARPDITLNVNDLEFKTELQKDREPIICNRTTLYLDKMGLQIENKTPTYIVTKEEKEFARALLRKKGYSLKKPIIGIQLYGSAISKTYPHMKEVVRKLKEKGYQIFYLDQHPYVYKLREVIAIANEMSLLITPNSFFYHVAGALRKRAIALFGYTDGKIWTEDYEQVTPIQIPCPKGKERCWWKIECVPGETLEEKEAKITPDCLSKIPVKTILSEVDRHFNPEKILITILTYNCLNLTKEMMDSVRSFHKYDIFVIDNASTDGTVEWLKQQKKKGVLDFISKKLTVCQACNIGLKKAWENKYDYMFLCSNDIILSDNYIDTLVGVAKRRKSYLIVGKTLNVGIDNQILHFSKFIKNVEIPIIDLPGGGFSATLISRECMEKIGGFDAVNFYPRYQEDEDYLLRVRLAGNDLIQTWTTNFLHLSGGVIKSHPEEMAKNEENWNRNVRAFMNKWGLDPYAQRSQLAYLDKIKQSRPGWRQRIFIPLSDTSTRRNKVKELYPVDVVKQKIERFGKATILITRRMGGFGDILFSTVLAKAFKKYFGKQIHVVYAIPQQFKSLLDNNPNIDRIIALPNPIKNNFDTIIDITNYEYRIEVEEILKYGKVQTPRTQIYLNLAGMKGSIHPDYFITKGEKGWGEEEWRKVGGGGKKIVIVDQGSNLMRTWPYMSELAKLLKKENFRVFEFKRKGGSGSFGNYPYSFRQVAAIVSHADLVVSVITGMANLAATLDIPTLTIFSNENGKIFAQMFESMIPIQGTCSHFPSRNYCGFTIPCLGTLENYRKCENIRIPSCLTNLKVLTVYNKILEVLK